MTAANEAQESESNRNAALARKRLILTHHVDSMNRTWPSGNEEKKRNTVP